MAELVKEATTVRRVLESFFRYFDNNNMWSPENGLALCVLLDLQSLMEKSGTFLGEQLIYFLSYFRFHQFFHL